MILGKYILEKKGEHKSFIIPVETIQVPREALARIPRLHRPPRILGKRYRKVASSPTASALFSASRPEAEIWWILGDRSTGPSVSWREHSPIILFNIIDRCLRVETEYFKDRPYQNSSILVSMANDINSKIQVMPMTSISLMYNIHLNRKTRSLLPV